MEQKIRVHLSKMVDYSYDIVIGTSLFSRIAKEQEKNLTGGGVAVITDSLVAPLYGTKLVAALEEWHKRVHLLTFPSGEKSKNRRVKGLLEDRLLRRGLGRDATIMALGGGVVGDLAGFVAATYHRGVPYIQIPTTLLAQVDSSVGGKTAIDVPFGKNLLGAFHQPACVYIDLDTLDTLPTKEFLAGLAEVVKYAVILDRKLFDFLEEGMGRILSREKEALSHLVARSCRLKAWVVKADEREENLRKILNFGHTIGHAIETCGRYGWRHGEAVAAGMVVEGLIACGMGYLDLHSFRRIRKLLENIGLPVCPPEGVEVEEVIRITCLDKKARQGRPQYVLPCGIGEMKSIAGLYGVSVEEDVIRTAWGEAKNGEK